MNNKPVWHLDSRWGRLESDRWRCAVELRHPERGLQQARIDDLDMSFVKPLCLAAQVPVPGGGESLEESYVRGSDLVASYAQSPGRTAIPQIYWRVLSGTSVWGVELWLSVQTSLLASDPSLWLWTELARVEHIRVASGTLSAPESVTWTDGPGISSEGDGRGLQVGALPEAGGRSDPKSVEGLPWNCWLVRFADCPISYCQLVYPPDCTGADWVATGPGRWELRHRLFPQPLEKGVIRRGRVRGGFVRRDEDESLAGQWFADMCTAPLPLTA